MKRPKPRNALDQASCMYGAGVLLTHLESLEREVQGVSAGEADIEFIHRARVGSRRLRAALPLFRPCLPEKKAKGWLKQIKDVTRALGAARDLDVQMESVKAFSAGMDDRRTLPGLARLSLRLRQQRQQVQPQVISAMRKLTADETINAMREHLTKLTSTKGKETDFLYTPSLYRQSYEAIRERLAELLEFRTIVFDAEKVTELHQMRIAAKRLRYTMETFAPLYASQLKPQMKAARQMQDQLGEIHDCDLWQQILEDFLAAELERIRAYFGHQRPYARLVPGIRAFEQDRRSAREKTYRDFTTDWQRWEEEGIWDELLRVIQVPLVQPEAIYPPLNRDGNNPSS